MRGAPCLNTECDLEQRVRYVVAWMTKQAIDSCLHDLVLHRDSVKTHLLLFSRCFDHGSHSRCTIINTRSCRVRSKKLSQSLTQNQQFFRAVPYAAPQISIDSIEQNLIVFGRNYDAIKFLAAQLSRLLFLAEQQERQESEVVRTYCRSAPDPTHNYTSG